MIRREINLMKDSGERINSTKLRKRCYLNISKTICWRYINKMGYKYKKSKMQIFLTAAHKQNRVASITEWIGKQTNWKSVIFSDEKRFCLDGQYD